MRTLQFLYVNVASKNRVFDSRVVQMRWRGGISGYSQHMMNGISSTWQMYCVVRFLLSEIDVWFSVCLHHSKIIGDVVDVNFVNSRDAIIRRNVLTDDLDCITWIVSKFEITEKCQLKMSETW